MVAIVDNRSVVACMRILRARGTSEMTDQTAATPSERVHALDLVRALALLLGMVFHAAL